jgi:aryl-alcohol dehydrogenase
MFWLKFSQLESVTLTSVSKSSENSPANSPASWGTKVPSTQGDLPNSGAGVVKAIGSGITHVKPGDKVVLSFAYCKNCPACNVSVPGVCYNYFNLNNNGGRPDGTPTMYIADKQHQPEPIHASFFGQSSFSRLTICHGISVVPVHPKFDSIPMETLAAFGCGFQTGAGASIIVINPAQTKPRTLAIFGVGAVGFSALFAAKATCPPETQIIAMDLASSRLELAQEFGAKTIDGRTVDLNVDGSVLEAVKKVTGGVALDAAIDTTGNTKLVAQIIGALAPLGRLVTLANSGWTSTVEIKLADLMMNAKQWVGSIEGNAVPETVLHPFDCANV